MTNKEFYGDKLLAVALENACGTFHRVVHGKNCSGKNCEDCEFSGNERILQWLNAEHEKPEPPLLENGDGLQPGEWIMVRDCNGGCWVKRHFLFYYDGIFYCELVDSSIGNGEYVPWNQARLPEDGE